MVTLQRVYRPAIFYHAVEKESAPRYYDVVSAA
jgi:hypothetical protein